MPTYGLDCFRGVVDMVYIEDGDVSDLWVKTYPKEGEERETSALIIRINDFRGHVAFYNSHETGNLLAAAAKCRPWKENDFKERQRAKLTQPDILSETCLYVCLLFIAQMLISNITKLRAKHIPVMTIHTCLMVFFPWLVFVTLIFLLPYFLVLLALGIVLSFRTQRYGAKSDSRH